MNPAAPWWFAMDDIRNPSSISVDTSVRAPVSEAPDAEKVPEEDQRAFHDVLAKGGELNESQSPVNAQGDQAFAGSISGVLRDQGSGKLE